MAFRGEIMATNTAHAEAAQTNPNRDLKVALDTFEESMLTPLVSGDVPQWAENVQSTWAEASAQIHDLLAELHPKQYEEMAANDPELLPRIEVLKQEDCELERQREELGQMIGRVTERAPELEPDEGKAARHAEKLVEAGIQFIARVRKQRVALQTWFAEAFTRDRGAVD
jgi:hypothetical protein